MAKIRARTVLDNKRPIGREDHPLVVGNYRIGTPAIESFYELIEHCLENKITGALIYGPSRIGKTRAIEYLRLLMAEKHPKVTTYHVQAEHKPKHAEGPFFTSLLDAVGCPEPDRGSNAAKRLKLIGKIKDACVRICSGSVCMFIDETQRLGENEYEWLRDVHDQLDRIQIKLYTFLVGQEELHAVKTAFQQARKTQIVARLMVEELRFYGLRNAVDTATCLQSYDTTSFPRGTAWSFTRFFVPNAVSIGFKLADDAQLLWDAFQDLHNKHSLPGELEIPMESFARAVEIMLKSSMGADNVNQRPDPALWIEAVKAPVATFSLGKPSAPRSALSPRSACRPWRRPELGNRIVLPILTFDENKLRPSYGYFFDRSWLAPYETIVGIAWKFARMNVLPGHIVAQQISLRPTDPYEGIAPILSNIDVLALAKTFAISRRALRVGIESPATGRRMSDHLRYCARCMGFSYHGVMHQQVGATRCPCHRTLLEDACRGCGFVSEYRLCARLLDTPFKCPSCRRLYGQGYGATLKPRPLPKPLRTAITRARCGC